MYPYTEVDEQQSLERLMQAQRGGKGGVYVKAAGNEFFALIENDAQGNPVDRCADQTRKLGVGCALANADQFNNLMTTIVAGAVNADGVRASYSSPGSALWVSGLGGEYGFQRAFDPHPETARPSYGLTNLLPLRRFYKAAIVTTDLSGCAAGNNRDRTRQM